jgi:hypothetical protein
MRSTNQPPSGDPHAEERYPPPENWLREVKEFSQRLAVGVVVFAVAGVVLWIAYQQVVLPVYGKLVLSLGFERGRAVEDLRDDLHYLRAALEENHPSLYAHQTSEQMDRAFARVEERLRDGMSASDLLVEAAPLVTAVGCGHTGLRAPAQSLRAVLSAGRLLPFGVRFVHGRAFLAYHYARGVEVPRGAELLAIGGRPMEEIRDRLLASLPSDRRSPTYNLAVGQEGFPYWFWLFVDRSSSFRVRFRDPDDGLEREVKVRARPTRRVIRSFQEQHPELDPYHEPPPMRMEILESERLAYLRLYTFAPQHRPNSSRALQEFFTSLAETGVETLVVDVRGNEGGPPRVSINLLRYLLPESFAYLEKPEKAEHRALGYDRYYGEFEPHETSFGGRLFVLLGPGSFSTTGHFLAHLAASERAIFVGQESGGGALCHDGSRHLELPHTGLRLRVATLPFRAAVGEAVAGSGILPHHEVVSQVDDFVAGRDTVLIFLSRQFGIDLTIISE